jgi:hypothetical protein
MQWSIHQEDIIRININVPKFRAPICTKQTLIELKGETDSSKIVANNQNIPLSIIYKTTGQSINKEMVHYSRCSTHPSSHMWKEEVMVSMPMWAT